METIRLIFALGTAAVAALLVFDVYRRYLKASGTTWQRLLSAGRDSATILWSKFVIVLAGLVGNLDSVADFLGQPEAKQYIQDALGNPKAVAAVMLAIAFVSMMARNRTLVN